MIDGAASRPRPVCERIAHRLGFGFGHFLGGLYWIAYAFMVDPSAHEWQIPFVLLLFPGGLGTVSRARLRGVGLVLARGRRRGSFCSPPPMAPPNICAAIS